MKTFRCKATFIAVTLALGSAPFAAYADLDSITLGIPNHKDGGSFNDKKNSSYEVVLVSQSGNTWNYRVKTMNGFALSHWVLGVPSCDGHYDSYTGGAEIGKDGSIKAEDFVGIKWNFEGDFTIVLDGNYPVASVPMLVKANTGYGTGTIMGPDCSAGAEDSGSGDAGAGDAGIDDTNAGNTDTSDDGGSNISDAVDITAAYCVSKFTSGSSQHVIGSMSGFASDFVFTESKGGRLVEYSDGTAHFYGSVKEVTKSGADINGGRNQLYIDVKLDGLTNIPPQDPKAKCDKDEDNVICRYYPTVTSGSLTGKDAFEGGEMTISRRGPAFQAGQGANAKNGNYGASMWYNFRTVSQPITGEKTFPSSGNGDFNIELHDCTEEMVKEKEKEREKNSCSSVIYAVHDGNLNDSQLLTIDPYDNYKVAPLGPEYKGYDLEGLDISPELDLYAASGDDAKGHPAGHLYKVDRATGGLTPVGPITFDYAGQAISGREISGLSFNPDGQLWGWSEECGLIKINKDDASAELVVPHVDAATVCADPNPANYTAHVEDLTWDETGTFIYAAEGNRLWKFTYASGMLELAATMPKGIGAVEMMETIPGGAILIGQQNKTANLGIQSFNPETVQIEAGVNVQTGDYYDIEGVAWPKCTAQ